MNIFELYLDKIKSILVDLNKKNELIIPETFNGINAEIPPSKFDCDISTNVAMVLSKLNKKSPLNLAEQISSIIKKIIDESEQSASLYPTIKKINEAYTIVEKRELLETLWVLVAADSIIDPYEENLFFKIAELIGIKRSLANKIKQTN